MAAEPLLRLGSHLRRRPAPGSAPPSVPCIVASPGSAPRFPCTSGACCMDAKAVVAFAQCFRHWSGHHIRKPASFGRDRFFLSSTLLMEASCVVSYLGHVKFVSKTLSWSVV